MGTQGFGEHQGQVKLRPRIHPYAHVSPPSSRRLSVASLDRGTRVRGR